MAQQNQYAYADESFRRVVIAEAELHLRGTYSGASSYVSRDAIDYGDSLYIALISVSGTAPEGNHSDFWSALSLISQGPPDPFADLQEEIDQAQSTADSALAGADAAYELAVIGTNLGSNAYDLAQAAYTYAVQGTSAAAALVRADEAYYLAMQGTNGANFGILLASQGTNGVAQLYPIATSGTAGANQAYALAQLGTNLAELALSWLGTLSPIDQGARDAAWSGTAGVEQLYPIATSGTAGVNQLYPIATSGTAGANQAYYLATQGTNGANFAIFLASQGTNGANDAYYVATQGTNGANFGIYLAGVGTNAAAYALSQALYAISIATTGTSGAAVANDLAYLAYQIAVSGTSGVEQVYPIANAGTAGANQAFALATSGTSGANAAYALAQIGTNQAGYILTIIGTTLGLVGTGTLGVNVAQLPMSSRADMRMTIQNGVITSFGSSGFSIENFQNYQVGVIGFNLGELGFMSAWFGTASINGFTNPQNALQAFVATDTMQVYTPGTVFSPGTLTAGTYWTTAYTPGSNSYGLSQDNFLSYTPGTATPGQISGGTSWFTAGAFI